MTAAVAAMAPDRAERRLAGAFIAVALVALFGGVVTGLLQALEHAGVNLYPWVAPLVKSYYHGLTLHGVLNVLVWTTFFIAGFLPFMTARTLGTPLASPRLGWWTFGVMVAGPGPGGDPPRRQRHRDVHLLSADARPLGLLRRAHPGRGRHLADHAEPRPDLARVARPPPRGADAAGGVRVPGDHGHVDHRVPRHRRRDAVPPDSLVARLDRRDRHLAGPRPLLVHRPPDRVFLASAGLHLLVHPGPGTPWRRGRPGASCSAIRWPGPRSSCSRSTPLGFHHQYTDPGIHQGWKLVHSFLTFAVFFPSLLTFFNVVASLESGARARGGSGLFAWFLRLPWGDPSLAAQVLAMVLFTVGGVDGLIDASYNLNLVVDNTAWIPGHLHLTVGSVRLTFMGVTYWRVPYLRGRALWSRGLALAQVWAWFVGMVIFSNAMHRLGMLGAPRRTMLGAAPYVQPQWQAILPLVVWAGASCS